MPIMQSCKAFGDERRRNWGVAALIGIREFPFSHSLLKTKLDVGNHCM